MRHERCQYDCDNVRQILRHKQKYTNQWSRITGVCSIFFAAGQRTGITHPQQEHAFLLYNRCSSTTHSHYTSTTTNARTTPPAGNKQTPPLPAGLAFFFDDVRCFRRYFFTNSSCSVLVMGACNNMSTESLVSEGLLTKWRYMYLERPVPRVVYNNEEQSFQ